MKKNLIPLIAVMLMTIVGCSKDYNFPPQQPPQQPPQDPPHVPLDDARTVLLKDVVAQALPSPYFHFVYDEQHYVKQIDFASGFNIYNVEYENKRVKKMTNINNGDFLLYSYSQDQVSEINEFSARLGTKTLSYQFSYNNRNQLTEVLWFDFVTNNTAHLYKKSVLTYQADGNLAGIDHLFLTGDQLTLVKRDRFSNYDNKTNVDDFYLLENFFDSFLFLPQVKLQKNNPLKHQLIGVDNDYETTYTYQYQNNLPVQKTGIVLQTRGPGSGQSFQATDVFTYY